MEVIVRLVVALMLGALGASLFCYPDRYSESVRRFYSALLPERRSLIGEDEGDPAILLTRMIGAGLLVGAIVIVIRTAVGTEG